MGNSLQTLFTPSVDWTKWNVSQVEIELWSSNGCHPMNSKSVTHSRSDPAKRYLACKWQWMTTHCHLCCTEVKDKINDHLTPPTVLHASSEQWYLGTARFKCTCTHTGNNSCHSLHQSHMIQKPSPKRQFFFYSLSYRFCWWHKKTLQPFLSLQLPHAVPIWYRAVGPCRGRNIPKE